MNHIQWVKSPKIFTNRSGQAGGGPKAVSLTAFSQVFFLTLPSEAWKEKGLWQIEELWRWLAGQAAVFGPVEVLVNNAGIGGARLSFAIVCFMPLGNVNCSQRPFGWHNC